MPQIFCYNCHTTPPLQDNDNDSTNQIRLEQQQNTELIGKLRIEASRQLRVAQTLQESLRRKPNPPLTIEAKERMLGMTTATVVQAAELLPRDIALADTRLTAMKALRRAIVERMEQSDDKMPDATLTPFQDEMELLHIDREIRAQEILIEELVRRYNEQLSRSVDYVAKEFDDSFERTQLERTNRAIEQIEDWILAATMTPLLLDRISVVPKMIVSEKPSPAEQIVIAGLGFVVFFSLPLLCAMCRNPFLSFR